MIEAAYSTASCEGADGMSPFVSVIMPVHNSLPYVEKACATVLSQTYDQFELLAIDDGSTDGSADFLEKLAASSTRLTVYRNPEQGAGSSRNLGLHHAIGEYVIFLDSDDIFDANLISEHVSNMIATESDVSVCEYSIYDTNSQCVYKGNDLSGAPETISPREISVSLMKQINSVPWNKMIRKALLDDYAISFQNCKHANDLYAVYSAIMQASKVGFVKKSLVNYRVNTGKSTQGRKQSHPLEMLVPFRRLSEERPLREEWQNALTDAMGVFNVYANYTGYTADEARKALWDEINLNHGRLFSDTSLLSSLRYRERALYACMCAMPWEAFQERYGRVIRTVAKMLPTSRRRTSEVLVACAVSKMGIRGSGAART